MWIDNISWKFNNFSGIISRPTAFLDLTLVKYLLFVQPRNFYTRCNCFWLTLHLDSFGTLWLLIWQSLVQVFIFIFRISYNMQCCTGSVFQNDLLLENPFIFPLSEDAFFVGLLKEVISRRKFAVFFYGFSVINNWFTKFFCHEKSLIFF